MLLGTLGANLLGNLLTGRAAKATSQGGGVNRVGKGRGRNGSGEGASVTRQGRIILRAGYSSRSSKKDF